LIIVDTDILIDYLRGRKEIKTKIQKALQAGKLATTSISIFELLSGQISQSEKSKI